MTGPGTVLRAAAAVIGINGWNPVGLVGIEAHEDGVDPMECPVNIVGAVRIAVGLDPADEQAHAAALASLTYLAAHLRLRGNPVRVLSTWSQLRTAEQVLAELTAAADAADQADGGR